MKIICVMGARPNFVKVAALYRAFVKYPGFSIKLVHTGQHHDEAMYKVFLTQLGLPDPDFALCIHGGSHTEQTARIMLAFEKVLAVEQPQMVVVVGDVNSSLACALVAAKEGVKLVHVEAGLRSGDKSMPEEINRILIDHISDELFVSEASAVKHLQSENVDPARIHFVGNVMIDSLIRSQKEAAGLSVLNSLGLTGENYIVLTMHRPSNVDSFGELKLLVSLIEALCEVRSLVFPVHPRTQSNLVAHGLWSRLENLNGLMLLPPQGYMEFINLLSNSSFVITDSGGIQEEATFLRVPCITFRSGTERPSTIDNGTNYVAEDRTVDAVLRAVKNILNNGNDRGLLPPLWDGLASDRIVEILKKKYIK